MKRDRGETPLHIAARFSYYEVAKLLISKGADVNVRNDFGWTPLHQAAYSFTKGGRKMSTIELLFLKGANVNAETDSGATPLDRCCSQGITDRPPTSSANTAARQLKN